MNFKQKQSKLLVAYFLGVLLFCLLLFVFKPLTIKIFLILLVSLLFYLIIIGRISDYYKRKAILSSYDPRSTYWDFFLDNRINFTVLNSIPDAKPCFEYETYKSEYIFFSKDDYDEEVLYINKEKIKFRIHTGKYKVYPLKDLKVIKLHHDLKSQEELGNIIILELWLTLKSGRMFMFNIRDIDCRIVDLENIMAYFSNLNEISLFLPKHKKTGPLVRFFNIDLFSNYSK